MTARVAEMMELAEESGYDDQIILDCNGNVVAGLEFLTAE